MDKLAAVIKDLEEGRIDGQFANLILEQMMQNNEQNQDKRQQRIKDKISGEYIKEYSTTPEEYVLEKERIQELHEFINNYLMHLTPRYQEVFLKRYVYGESIKKIGKDLKISFQAVDCYLKRIDSRRGKIFRKLLEQYRCNKTLLREEVLGLLTENEIFPHHNKKTLMGFPFENYTKGKCRLKEYLGDFAKCPSMGRCKTCNTNISKKS